MVFGELCEEFFRRDDIQRGEAVKRDDLLAFVFDGEIFVGEVRNDFPAVGRVLIQFGALLNNRIGRRFEFVIFAGRVFGIDVVVSEDVNTFEDITCLVGEFFADDYGGLLGVAVGVADFITAAYP